MNPIQKHVLKRNETAEMTERELLMELVEEKRRAETWRYIQLVWYLIILLAVIILAVKFLPGIIAFFKELHDTLQSVKETADQISQGYSELKDSISSINLGGGFSLGDLLGSLGNH